MNVGVNNALSGSASVRSGVPQGYVLIPSLYLCYSADLQHVVNNSTVRVHANDSKLYKAILEHLEVYLLLQRYLDRISKWTKDLTTTTWRKIKS